MRGASTERIRQQGHDTLSTYGLGADLSDQDWRSVIRQLLARGILVAQGDYGTLALGEAAGVPYGVGIALAAGVVWVSVALGVTYLVMMIVGLAIVDRVGRRRLTLVMVPGAALALFVLDDAVPGERARRLARAHAAPLGSLAAHPPQIGRSGARAVPAEPQVAEDRRSGDQPEITPATSLSAVED